MTRQFARILLVTLVALALGGIAACGDSGPAEQAEQAVEDMGDAVADMGEAAKDVVESEEDEKE